MKKSSHRFLAILAGLLWLFVLGFQVTAAEENYIMMGEIKAIETASKTVVVEVPVGNRLYTVGGPLSARAVLRKGGHLANLFDFAAGDKVTVHWKKTDTGHIIEALDGK
ncbi:MAG: hypothetical protein PVG99_08520 [Desulfobacteraceae bacterium]|jgi:hypothetical protein